MEKALKIAAPSNDENVIENVKKLVEVKQTRQPLGAGEREVKRAALGDLGNRNRLNANVNDIVKSSFSKNNTSVAATTKTIDKDDNFVTKRTLNLKHVKPKVVTHWQKDEAKKLKLKTTKVTTVFTSNVKPTKVITVKSDDQNILKQEEQQLPMKLIKVKITDKLQLQKQPSVCKKEEKKSIENGQLNEVNGASSKNIENNSNVKQEIKNKFKIEKKIELKNNTKVLELTESYSTSQLKNIINIDLRDEHNIYLVPEYANDIYSYLTSLEVKFSIRKNHLDKQIEVTPKMRSILLDWLHSLHCQFHLLLESYYMTVDIIDRYLQKVSTTIKQELQLVGVTAMFIATKYEELYAPEVADLVFMTDNTYTKEQIYSMELKILKKINFNLCRPVPILFLRRFSRAADITFAGLIEHDSSKYIMELASIDYDFSHYPPSKIAAASLLLSLILFRKDTVEITIEDIKILWTPTLIFYSKYTIDDLLDLVIKLSKLVMNAPVSRFTSVYIKYTSEKYRKVSKRKELTISNITIKLKKIYENNDEQI